MADHNDNDQNKKDAMEVARHYSHSLTYDVRLAHLASAGLEQTVITVLKKVAKKVAPKLATGHKLLELQPGDAEIAVMMCFLSRMVRAVFKQVMYAQAPQHLETDDMLKQCYVRETAEKIAHDPTEEVYLRSLYEINEAVMDANMEMLTALCRTLWCVCPTCDHNRKVIFHPDPKEEIMAATQITTCVLNSEFFETLREEAQRTEETKP